MPKLYITRDILGVTQHLASVLTSNIIAAINDDLKVSISEVANYGLVGDLFKVVPMLIAKLKTD